MIAGGVDTFLVAKLAGHVDSDAHIETRARLSRRSSAQSRESFRL
jgi:hypothetical protein